MKRVLSFLLAVVMLLSLTTGMSITAQAEYDYSGFNQKLNQLRAEYPEGMVWTNSNSYPAGWYGCWAFANICAQRIFGYATPRNSWGIVNVASTLPGDVITTGSHTMFVINVVGDTITVAEGNYAGKIHWGRQFNKYSESFTVYHSPNYNSVIGSTDNTPPACNDFVACEFREGAFTVHARIIDSSGISSVRYAIWTEKNGQDDIIWYDAHCTDGNDYYWSRVNFSEHKNEKGTYIIHMYAYDNAGNLTNKGITYTFPDKAPTVSNIQVSDVSSKGYTVKCTVKSVSEMGVSRVQFPTWTSNNGQDDLVPDWGTSAKVMGTISGNTVTYRVNASEHNNEQGTYITHIYAYDKIGNTDSVGVTVNVHDHSWNRGVITKAATCTAAGTKKFTCTVCGESKTETIAKIAHQYKKEVIAPTAATIGYTVEKCSLCGNEKSLTAFTAPTGKLTPKHSARTVNAIRVTWNNEKTATGYQVQISTKDGKKWSNYATLKAGVTAYTFKNLAAGNIYKFRVRFFIKAADGNNYYSPWSSTLTSPTLPSGTTLTKLTPAKKAFTAQWKKAGVTGYQIQYSASASFSGAKTLTVKNAKTLKAAVKKLNAKKVYYVRIRTYKTISKVNYFSTWSKTYKVKTK